MCVIIFTYTLKYVVSIYKHRESSPPSVAKTMKERRAFSTESIQLQQKQKSSLAAGNRYSPVLALRDAVRAEREQQNLEVSILSEKAANILGIAPPKQYEVSILSEKAASILGIAPPKQYKRASMYDPVTEKRSDVPARAANGMPPRSNSYHPGLKRGKAFDKGVSRT